MLPLQWFGPAELHFRAGGGGLGRLVCAGAVLSVQAGAGAFSDEDAPRAREGVASSCLRKDCTGVKMRFKDTACCHVDGCNRSQQLPEAGGTAVARFWREPACVMGGCQRRRDGFMTRPLS